MNRFTTWLRSTPPKVLGSLVAFMFVIACGVGGFLTAAGCTNTPKAADVTKVELDLCRARVTYKLLAAAAGGALDPAPGSPRAELEQAEDAFCAARAALAPAPDPAPSPPAGSEPLQSSTPPKN